jgi:hypothetical protein
MLPLRTTLRQVARQKYQTNKLSVFSRRWSMKWEQDGRIGYSMHYGHTEQPTKYRLECHHINLSVESLVTYLLS